MCTLACLCTSISNATKLSFCCDEDLATLGFVSGAPLSKINRALTIEERLLSRLETTEKRLLGQHALEEQ